MNSKIEKKSPLATRNSQILLPPLNAIVDADVAARHGWTPVDLARAYWDGGARFLQIRAKEASSRELLALMDGVLTALSARGAGRDTIVIVNDRADVARIAGASGVHVGQDDLSPADVRRVLPGPAIVGWSTHTRDQIAASAREPVDYIAVGPVFGTLTKNTGYDAVGVERVRDAARGARPVVAIGGITLASAASVIAAGATSVAVISDLLTGNDPARRVRALLDTLARV